LDIDVSDLLPSLVQCVIPILIFPKKKPSLCMLNEKASVPLTSTVLPNSPSGRAILSKFGKMFFGYQPTLLVGAVLIAMPAAWITKVHMDWKPKPDSKKRMLIAHGVFWSSMLLGFKALHAALFALPERKILSSPRNMRLLLQQLFNAKTRGPAAATLAVAAMGLGGFIGSMIGGFEGGIRLAKALVPKQAKPAQPLQSLASPPYYFSPMRPHSSAPSLNLLSPSFTPQPFNNPMSPLPSVPHSLPIKPRLQTSPQYNYRSSAINYPLWQN
jgi:hypothetical protein